LHFIIAGFESTFHSAGEGESVMPLQTQSAQVFTIFGNYVLDEGNGEYLPLTPDLVAKTACFKKQAIERKDQYHDWNHDGN
jgi:hypothetical protein